MSALALFAWAEGLVILTLLYVVAWYQDRLERERQR